MRDQKWSLIFFAKEVIRLTDKIKHFHEYCNKCQYKDTSETEDPCDACLTVAGDTDYSHKPINFKEKEGK